jgi:ABC-2 type transport system ATP-binding protein
MKRSVAQRCCGTILAVLVLYCVTASAGGTKKGVKPGSTKKEIKAPKELRVDGVLTPDLPFDPVRRGSHHKVYRFPMKGGSTYTIDLMSPDFDDYLRLEDSTGKELRQDDDNGLNQNARIIFRAPRDDTYRLIVTSFAPGATGRYTLWVRPGVAPPTGHPGPFGGGFFRPGPFLPPPPLPEQVFGDITVRPEQQPMFLMGWAGGNRLSHGYVAYRFILRNLSAKDSHRVTLKMPQFTGGGTGPYLSALRRTVEVGPNASAILTLFEPDLVMPFGGGMLVTVDGKDFPASLSFNLEQGRGMRFSNWMGGVNPITKVLVQLSNPDELRFVPAGLGHGSLTFERSAQPVSAWSDDWLSYSSYDGLILDGKTLAAAPAAVREALWRYVEAGGSLTILGKADLPAGWRQRHATESGLTCYYPGFGECLIYTPEGGQFSKEQWERLADSWEHTTRPWQSQRSITQANRDFPVVSSTGIPVRGLFILILLFAIGIGPVNLYFLSRKRRRMWMLWTIPVISFLTCLLVLGYMVITEGWHGYRRAQTLTILNEGSKRASTVGWVGYYSPLAPSDGLHFSMETELSPQLVSDTHYYRSGTPRTLDWTEEQHLGSGWITARIPAHFMVRKSEKSRLRLALHRQKDGSLSVVNLLKADIGKLWLADRDGKIYSAADLAAGKEATLVLGERNAQGEPAALRQLFSGEWLQHYKSLTEHPEDYLLPGCYIATLDGTPFLEEGMTGARPRGSRSVVYGIMGESRPHAHAKPWAWHPRSRLNGNGKPMRVNVVHLRKYYGRTRAVDDISFSFASGQIFGFVGPNGAGKSTTMRILATLDEPTAGDALVDGVSVVEDPEKARRLIGYVPDSLPTHRDLSVHDYLDFFARAYALHGRHRAQVIERIEEFTNLTGIRDKRLVALSKGMKQRVSVARALLHDPPVLVMDEPAASLDPRARIELRELLKLLSWQGKAILISSHILTELSEICTGAVIIERGRILRAGTMEQILRHDAPRRTVIIRIMERHEELHKRLLETPNIEAARVLVDNSIEADLNGAEDACCDLLAGLVRDGFRVAEFRQRRADLEEVFMNVTRGEVQ